MLLLVTTADTEVLTAVSAAERLHADAALADQLPGLRARNASRAPGGEAADPGSDQTLEQWLDEAMEDAEVVLLRVLGGRAGGPGVVDGLATRCRDADIPLLAFGGEDEPDAEMTELSTVPVGVVAQAFEYLRFGGVDNHAQLLRFVADTVLLAGTGFDPPRQVPSHGTYHPDAPAGTDLEALARDAAADGSRPTVGVVFYRAHVTSGNTAFVDTLLRAIEAEGARAVGIFAASLRPDEAGATPALDDLTAAGVHLDTLVVTVLATGGGHAADTDAWAVPTPERLDVPVVQAIATTSSRADWLARDNGLSPLDVAMYVAMPEFDGRIVTVPFSFKEHVEVGGDGPVDAQVQRYVADPERSARVAGIATRLARLRTVPNARKRVALVLSNYPTKHSRVGNGVGLDTPASAVGILTALRDAGYELGEVDERFLTDGDALVHELIDRGGIDAEHLTDEQLEAATAKVPAETYAEWFSRLPEELREGVREAWGDPPGEVLTTPDGSALVAATLPLGNVVLAIQPPRGFGENPVAIYHDPDLPPTHQYFATYWWLERVFEVDAIVHVGKHGTLEWLPGKGVGLSSACAPDAALGSVPLFYPFVVNDPGEGTQAKRRVHATVVDHLVPPMMRAETYDDIAKLEQLLDEYAEVELLDPSKLPAIRARVWELLVTTNITSDLGVEELPEDDDAFGDLITHVDGYLCEIKDLQVRDGLHVFGTAPRGEQLVGLTNAIMRLPQGVERSAASTREVERSAASTREVERSAASTQTPGGVRVEGLRRSVCAAFGTDELTLTADPTVPCELEDADRQRLLTAAPGPFHTAGDVLDRVDAVTRGLLEELAAGGFSAASVDELVRRRLEVDPDEAPGRGVADALRFAATEVVPRILAADEEIEALVRALAGRFVRSGPSGSPTRGRLDVLPTGKNFASVDPRGVPSELAWETGQRLADDLLRRHLADEGRYPTSIGIVVWGTANMRTGGDDVAEILALLGVRPVWHAETRRVTGLELIEAEELERPRVDVTVRISGFFRDAFPHLVQLLDDAVQMVAELDEDDEANPIAAHARADRERLRASGIAEDEAARRATARIFGSRPGAYGSGLLALIDARNWRDSADLAEVYGVWGGHAYGAGLDGAPAREDFETNLRRVEVAVKNVDTREHDLLDSDDYFQEHGGMVAAIRHLTGSVPSAVIGDSSDPARPRNRSLQEEVNRVFRARIANPRWIASMQRHGYKGAFELSATVDYLFGYDATAGVVADWQYAEVAERYVLDEPMRAFLEEVNPWARAAMAERLLEAAQRGLWEDPDAALLDRLRDAYLEADAQVEGRGEVAEGSGAGEVSA